MPNETNRISSGQVRGTRRRNQGVLFASWIGLVGWQIVHARGWMVPPNHRRHYHSLSSNRRSTVPHSSRNPSLPLSAQASSNAPAVTEDQELFDDFVDFLLTQQSEIIQSLEDLEVEYSAASNCTPAVFSRDTWGIFEEDDDDKSASSSTDDKPPVGGITRVIQGGQVIEKGACSFTLIGQGILSKERAATIRARQQQHQQQQSSSAFEIQEGDRYAAAALSMVLHSRSPHVPTFRSDVRVFLVQQRQQQPQEDETTTGTNGDDPPAKTEDSSDRTSSSMAWFGGGADLTPYYLIPEDIAFFHQHYADLCDTHWGKRAATSSSTTDDDDENNHNTSSLYSYASMKKACDEYFYLPARQEHRGTGGIFFDDMALDSASFAFCQGVVTTWMPSWIPLVRDRQETPVTDQHRQWQYLRRGRYLEFNLLYDRGVRFGLANANPRVEGVMVSAPPVLAFEYNHVLEPGSPEAELMAVLKTPQEWID